MLSACLGHEIISVLAVVSAFFSGLALGAWFLDRIVGRSKVPGNWYVLLEIVIAAWAIVLVFLLPVINPKISTLIGISPSPFRHWAISFLYPFLVLLPATAAMGGTLATMDRLFDRLRKGGRSVPGLYSLNTFGAVVGTFLTTFLLLPQFGINVTAVLLATINFMVALAVIVINCKSNTVQDHVKFDKVSGEGMFRLYLTLFITGFLGIGYEVLLVRALSQILENTVFSFAIMLIVFLFGTAVGAGIYQQLKHFLSAKKLLTLLLLSTSFFCLLSIGLLGYLHQVFLLLQSILGGSFQGSIAAEFAVSGIYFLMPTICMGATFSHLAQSAKRSHWGVGRALCLNTLGGAFAPFFFGIFLLPLFGITKTLLLLPLGYLCCLPRMHLRKLAFVMLVFLPLGAYLALNFEGQQFVTLEDDETIVHFQEGVMASVSVVKDSRKASHLKVNNHFQMGGTTSLFSDRRQAYLPLLLHPAPENVLFLGLGTGATFAAAETFQEINAVGVELIPEVISAMKYFEKSTGKIEKNDKLEIINADARRYVTSTDNKYDVVIADLFHPARDGASSLYTVEHFSAIGELLTEDGIFCQWLPLYQLDSEMFKVITRTFLEAFPNAQAYLAHYSIDQPIIGLVGGNKKLRYPEKWLNKRLKDKSLRRYMAGFGYDSIYSLLGTFIASEQSLRYYSEGSPLNTDKFPVVLFQAPRFVYTSSEPAHKRLLTLLHELPSPDPESVLAEVVTEEDYLARSRLVNYWQARNSFLALGTKVQRTRNVIALYETASEPLLGVVRKSLDFSAAYFPLISIAYSMYPLDQERSYELLRALERANPLRPEAGNLRQQLFVQKEK